MTGHVLGLFEGAAVLKVRCDPGRPERVAANLVGKACGLGPAFHELPNMEPAHRFAREIAVGARVESSEEGALPIAANRGGLKVSVDVGLQIVVGRHLDNLAILLVQPEPPTLALLKIIFDLERYDRANAGERVAHGGQDSPVTEPDDRGCVDRIEKLPSLLGVEDRRFAAANHMLGTADRVGWVHIHDVPGNHPIEQHPDGGEGLLDGRFWIGCAKFLDVRCDGDRLNAIKR